MCLTTSQAIANQTSFRIDREPHLLLRKRLERHYVKCARTRSRVLEIAGVVPASAR